MPSAATVRARREGGRRFKGIVLNRIDAEIVSRRASALHSKNYGDETALRDLKILKRDIGAIEVSA